MGVEEHKDVVNAVKIAKNNGCEKIVIVGTSQGAASAMLAAEKLGDEISGLVLENPFCCGSEVVRHSLEKAFGRAPIDDPIMRRSLQKATDANPLLHARALIPYPFIHLIHTLALNRMGYSPEEHSPINIVDKIPVPIFFMHGTEDTFVPMSHTQRLARAAESGASTRVTEWYPPAGHSLLYNAHSVEFVNRVTAFYNAV
eukprot:TRINITY_DN15016_c0_g1_i1.p1 TRINITY_DN15016_c0_g1~~TRINITY_DN15016_c0_g1_i1.p1  ORF type:complete len:235 (+),score=45.32 TRINITY_DN15016_c0_g1_i1:108-707(+)